ncbi:unnamed protein product [Scytosiphon promiscuus]
MTIGKRWARKRPRERTADEAAVASVCDATDKRQPPSVRETREQRRQQRWRLKPDRVNRCFVVASWLTFLSDARGFRFVFRSSQPVRALTWFCPNGSCSCLFLSRADYGWQLFCASCPYSVNAEDPASL